MKKTQFKSHASSSRATISGFGGLALIKPHSSLSYFIKAPDLSSIENPHVVVAFKNLTKKDENTRSRALQDLRAYLHAQAKERNGIDDHIIEAWVNLYPRLCIDFSRTIRDQAHNIQYDLLSLSQKRMSVRVSRFVGSWLAGQFDRDRTVASNVKKTVISLLPTDEKLVAFYSRHQAASLRYACDAIEETPETLSDERTMSKADMWAKYFIAIGSSVSLVVELLQKLNEIERSKLQESYDQFLSNNKLWKLVSCEDSGIRRTICELLIQCCQKQRHVVSNNLDVLSKAFISKGLSTPQQGSISKILDALQILTIEFPEIWEVHQRNKISRKACTKHPFTELNSYILAGPRLEPIDFWKSLQQLIKVLPLERLPKKSEEFIEFLQNLQASLSGKVGMRFTTKNAWDYYLDITEFLIANLPDKDSLSDLLEKVIFPLFNKYFSNILNWDQSVENISFTITSEVEFEVVFRAYKLCLQHSIKDNAFQNQWELLGAVLISGLKICLPDKTKNFQSLQSLVSRLSKLWFLLLAEVVKYLSNNSDFEIKQDPIVIKSIEIVEAAFEVLVSRNGKQYCAAEVLQDAILLTPTLFTFSPDRPKIVRDLLLIHLPKLLYSPSAALIVPIIFQQQALSISGVNLESIWLGIIDNFLSTYESISIEVWAEIAITLISHDEVSEKAQNHQQLQRFLVEQIDSFVHKKHSSKGIFHAALKFNVLSQSSALTLRDSLIKYLNGEYELQRVLSLLNLLNSKMHHLMDVECDIHVVILSRLLAIEECTLVEQETHCTLVKEIQELRDAIMGSDYAQSMSKLVTTVLKENGNGTHNLSQIDDPELVNLLLPTTDDWYECLYQLADQLPGDAIAALPDFGSFIYLININFKNKCPEALPSYDTYGLTMPLRKAIFTLDLLFNSPYKVASMDSNLKLLELTFITLEITKLDIEFLFTSYLFNPSLLSDEKKFLDHFLHSASEKLKSFADGSNIWPRDTEQYVKENSSGLNMNTKINEKGSTTTMVWDLITKLVKVCELHHPISFYAAKALIRLLGYVIQISNSKVGWLEDWISNLTVVKPSTQNIVGASAILVGLGKCGKASITIENLCNHLIGDLLSLSADSNDLIQRLVLLNSCLTIYDGEEIPVAKNRLVFSVKHVISWTQRIESCIEISEICRLLQRLLPSIKDIYGSFWEESLEICISIWMKQKDKPIQDENLAAVVTSLKLYSSLKEIEEPNDDLSEALIEHNEKITSCLLALLFVKRPANHKSLLVMNETLANLIFKILPDKVEDINKYYALLASNYFWVQSSAYMLIFKCLPKLQQQLSVDIILKNRDASLPEELLSLILTAPNCGDINISPHYIEGTSPEFPTIRCYLLAWLLTFQIFAASSYKVRSDLNKNLKYHKCIEPLLDTIFQILCHNNENLLDLKKENISSEKIQDYDLLTSVKKNDSRTDLIWILISLYFQSLKYAPSAVKSWWLDCKKQMKNSICLWTEKFMSPLLVEEELNAVISWAESQDSLDDDQNLVVKVAKNVREVSVGYEIDDMMMRFLIRVPENYPLDLVKVQSINRVGVSEQKWNSFLMTTNGVINFSVLKMVRLVTLYLYFVKILLVLSKGKVNVPSVILSYPPIENYQTKNAGLVITFFTQNVYSNGLSRAIKVIVRSVAILLITEGKKKFKKN
ncbi:putative c3hc4 type zinc finger containing protein [Erysiphe neolycopersici]|uniref:E3 ubiquitin-protein ligase listerin n=1 Tax=Erysiphe neolycopersici TaxID=212602 RepID=A0A420I509_9PEZI|nr:putative c3hc4 type zinc finger containing protein [Erysiphe neolycopersici]